MGLFCRKQDAKYCGWQAVQVALPAYLTDSRRDLCIAQDGRQLLDREIADTNAANQPLQATGIQDTLTHTQLHCPHTLLNWHVNER